MALTVNGRSIGRAAQIEAAEIREQVRQAQSQSLRDETLKMCGELIDAMPLAEYTAFVADAPDGNQAFYEAVKAKHAEVVKGVQTVEEYMREDAIHDQHLLEEETQAEHELDANCVRYAGCN